MFPVLYTHKRKKTITSSSFGNEKPPTHLPVDKLPNTNSEVCLSFQLPETHYQNQHNNTQVNSEMVNPQPYH
uniref:Uncharacterized protein n=1 Tax=Cucumis melo TaxID=3656 RepID=A0A9I9EAD0_CUCME